MRWLGSAMVFTIGLLAAIDLLSASAPTSTAEDTPKERSTPLPTISADDLELLKRIFFTIEAEPDMGEAPLKVAFKLELFEDEELKKPRFHWDFGDGTTSKQREPVHVFKRPGEYKVSCRIDDVDERWGRDELTIFVDPKEVPPTPVAPEKKETKKSKMER